jgi:hypothetical protein
LVKPWTRERRAWFSRVLHQWLAASTMPISARRSSLACTVCRCTECVCTLEDEGLGGGGVFGEEVDLSGVYSVNTAVLATSTRGRDVAIRLHSSTPARERRPCPGGGASRPAKTRIPTRTTFLSRMVRSVTTLPIINFGFARCFKSGRANFVRQIFSLSPACAARTSGQRRTDRCAAADGCRRPWASRTAVPPPSC